MQKILVVEDDEKLNQIICACLGRNQYLPTGCMDAAEACSALCGGDYSLIISDIMMPGMDGFEFVRTVRETNPEIPILFVTALDDLPSKTKGFHSGVDDYMVKPIDMEELLLRVEALLRRARLKNENRLEVGTDLVLVKDEMTAYFKGKEVTLLPREFGVLYRLLSHPRKVFTRSELLDEYWGMDSGTGLRTVDVYVARIRNKFADCRSFEIVTVHGFGYKAVLKE